MTKLEHLQKQRKKAEEKQVDYLAKAKKEEEKIKDLDTQIILAKYEERSDYLAKHQLTWADVKRQIEEGKLKGEGNHVPFNESDLGHANDLQE